MIDTPEGAAILAGAAALALVAVAIDRARRRGANIFALLSLGVTLAHVVLLLHRLAIARDSDLYVYARQFEFSEYYGVAGSIDQAESDAAFAAMMGLFAGAGLDFEVFWSALVVILTLNIAVAIARSVGFPRAALIVALLPAWFPYVNYSTNTLRQGLAASLVVLALSPKGARSGWPRLLILWSACLVHWSAVAPAVLVTIYLWLRPSRQLLWLLVTGSVVLFVTGANAVLLESVANMYESSRTYTELSTFGLYGAEGNRLDFLLFTGALIAALVVGERVTGYANPALDAFLVLCIGYFLFGFIAFSDRMAAFAWIYWPVALAVAVPRGREKAESPQRSTKQAPVGRLRYVA